MSLLVVYLIYAQVQVPIKQLVTSFQKLKNEDYSIRLKPKGNSEFSFLFTRFNSMAAQIQDLFGRVYLEKIHVKKARLKQLQSQINPHFFYNCFSFISSMAKLQNYGAIIAMSQNLSDYYRYTTRQERDFVALSEEKELVGNYLDIQQMRMKRLSYDVHLPPWLKGTPVPPLVIQPLVENAVLHGIEPHLDAGRVVIRAEEKDGQYAINVDDDGQGLDDAAMLELQKKLSRPMDEEMGCGLWNVHQRLHIRYGARAGLSFSQSPLGGLRATLTWSVQQESDEPARRALPSGNGQKPVNDAAFIQSLTSMIEALKEEWEKADKYHKLVYTMKSDHNVLRQNMLGELLLGKQLSDVSIMDKLKQYEVKVQPGDSAMLMSVQLGRYFTGMDDNSVKLMEYAIGNIAEEVFPQPYRLWHGKAPHDGLAIVVSAPPGVDSAVFRKEVIRDLAGQLQEKVGAFLKGDIALALTNWFTFPGELAGAYRSALSAVYRTQQSDNAILFLDELEERAVIGVKAIEELYKPPTFIHLLESGQWGASREKLAALFDSLDGRVLSKEQLYEVFLSITNAYLYVAHKQGTDIYQLDPSGMDIMLDRSMMVSADRLRAWSDGMLGKLEAELSESDSYNKKHVIKQVQELVTGDLGADTSVKTIADKVFLHPVYLSKIYKSETGESLGDYIIRMRMERAVYLLKSSNKEIYEITTELGYQNPQYFSKIFRKYYGMTPNEYRD